MSECVPSGQIPDGSLPDAGEFAACIIKQTAAKMTAFGFPNNPHGATVGGRHVLSANVFAMHVYGIADATVAVLVVHKGHVPVEAWHVVDFRVGDSGFYERVDDPRRSGTYPIVAGLDDPAPAGYSNDTLQAPFGGVTT